MLESLITSKTRLRLLVKFFISATNKGHLRGLAEEFDESTNSIRKELNQLSEAGYLIKEPYQNKIIYTANTQHLLFEPIRKLIHSYLGLDQIVERVLNEAGDVQEIYLVGDYARGIDSGYIEVRIVAEQINEKYLEHLMLKVAKLLNKSIKLHINTEITDVNFLLLYQA